MHALKATYYDKDSLVLILGSFPSKHSRQCNFYYQHPTNRFWKILENLFNISLCQDTNPKNNIKKQKAFLRNHKIVLWDTIISCNALGSKDSDLEKIQINDGILDLLNSTSIEAILINGSKAKESFQKLYKKHQKVILAIKEVGNKHFELKTNHRIIQVHLLPSTSALNFGSDLEALIEDWKIIKSYIL